MSEVKEERLGFQTEARQLLNLVIHSLYSHKEIFVRELISNASDALDRLRFEALTRPEIISGGDELAIRIKLNAKGNIFTISDNGTGMTRQEVIDHIGTIARSGSRAFLEKLTGDQKADSTLIGQFGVGFYSAFMVASKVRIVTRRAGTTDPAVVWESDGISDYTLAEGTKDTPGTEITVFLKDGEGEFAEPFRVRSIIKKYSDFIAFPIYLPDEKGKDTVANETKPLWKRAPSEISEEQYSDFYQQTLGGFGKPVFTIHSKAEGVLQYAYVLYIPEKMPPFELYNTERNHGVKLYVRRVFIMDHCRDLLPEYLRFVKGVVDSEDLPLNVSREILQENPMMPKIRNGLISKTLSKLAEMAEKQPDLYRSFWKEFGPVLKEGVHSDRDNREKLVSLCRFQSSMGKGEDDVVSLKDYIGRMRADQKHIYYITGQSRSLVEQTPHLEIFKSKSIEVLYLVDPIDEFIVLDIYKHENKELKSITKGDLDLGDLGKEEKEASEKASSEFKKLTERFKNILADTVKEVRITTRLKDSPCCLVSDENEMGLNMEKIMKVMGQTVQEGKRILEVNPLHPVIINLNRIYTRNPKDVRMDEWVRLLFDQALIAEGERIKDPTAFTRRLSDLLSRVSAE